jgi:hypothetical protein
MKNTNKRLICKSDIFFFPYIIGACDFIITLFLTNVLKKWTYFYPNSVS